MIICNGLACHVIATEYVDLKKFSVVLISHIIHKYWPCSEFNTEQNDEG